MRITSKDFYNVADRLESVMGVKLTTNVWHKHFSVYTCGKNPHTCQDQLVSSDTARDACDQMWAILNALEVIKRNESRKTA